MSSYWADRFISEEERRDRDNRRYYSTIEKEYNKALAGLEKDIEYWLGRIAKNNDISLSGAKELLSKKELQEFKWTVEEYIKKGEENGVSGQWLKQLENASARVHIQRLEALKIQIQDRIENMYATRDRSMEDYLCRVYKDTYYHTVFEIDKGVGSIQSSFNKLDDRKILQIIHKPWAVDGKDFSTRIWEDKANLVNTLHTGLTQSLIRGGNLNDVVNDISQFVSSKIKNKKYVANRLVTTESAAYASKAQEQAYKDLSVDKYEILATLDLHTSDICQDLDGKIFDRKDYQVGVTAPPFHPNCYDKETEILTNQGWKFFRDLTKKDLVYTLNKDTLIPEWQKPINYIFYNYKGKLLYYKNSRFDLMITPEHKIMVQNMDSSVKDKSWKLKSAITVGRKSKNRMLSGINWKGINKEFETLANKKIPIELYLKFMAYWLADGSCTKDRSSYSVKISQYKNEWMYEELKYFPFKIYKCKESLMIHNKELGIELSKFGKCTEKYIPENIKELSPELIRIFLMSYAKTDGYIKKGKEWKGYQFDDSIVFFTTSDKLASDLGELILKAGGRPSYYLNKIQGKEIEFKNGKYTINKDCWVISWNKQIHTWLSNLEITEINYDDVVYCVEVPKYNTLLVRRNGKVCWSGNCRTTTVPWFPDDVDTGERTARGKDGKVGYVPQNMTYKEWYNKYVEQKFEESGIIELDNNSSNSVIKRCIEKEIEYIGIEKSSAIPLEEVIISELGGGDKTRGSCSSLAFAYAGNKNGYKVLDFRGGNSQAVFARNKTILEITELEGIRSWVVYEKNDFTALKKLITNMEEKKEYYLAIGRHAAIIRKIEKRYEYLELQSAKCNGFKTLDVGVLKNRFGCQKSYRRAGMTIAPPSMLIDIDTLKGNKEFNQILGFINTAKEKQLKGVEGYEK